MPGHFLGRNVELGKYMDRIIGIVIIPFRINNFLLFCSLALCFYFVYINVSFEHVIPFHQVINALRVEKMFNMEGAVCNT